MSFKLKNTPHSKIQPTSLVQKLLKNITLLSGSAISSDTFYIKYIRKELRISKIKRLLRQ